MIVASDVSRSQFEQAVTPGNLRVSQIIYVALGAGPFLFLLGVLFLYAVGPHRDPDPSAFSTANMLSALNALLVIVLPYLGATLSSKAFSYPAIRDRFADISSGQVDVDPNLVVERCLSIIRSASIIQLATLEACAFAGLSITIELTTQAVSTAEPIYLLNLASCIPLYLYAVTTFPTKDRLADVFVTRIQSIHQAAANV
jgi:hypothetical protein